MKKLKVYDVDAFCRDSVEMMPFHYGQAAIIEGTKGVILAEHEAVHQIENLLTDSVVLPVAPIPQNGGFPIFATHEWVVQLSDIAEKAPCKEMTMEEFFDKRDYNSRCQRNFMGLMASMREIGLEPKEYMQDKAQEKKGLEALIGAAESKRVIPEMAAKQTERGIGR